ncbi:hypothetical protein Q9R19_12070 [Microbacterium sp. ARD32]|uniref:hypothetical protein n=1 Tax=Microbacterium sp. ARD32 TaxID=2962577 RepID=UPI002881EF71|nr:hypothetical protein [Microbacterium sp. ARD32]MDT0158366.1 hypothetical protein [Microbacterium sp. ARD32]
MTTTGDPRGGTPSGVSASLALVVGFVGFAALGILGLGMLSYFADIDILSAPGLGWRPGVVGMLVAIGVFCGALRPSLRRGDPSFLTAFPVALGAAAAHLLAVWLTALLIGAGTASAFAAAAQLIVRGSSTVVLAAAAIGAWVAIALRRTRVGAPRWPWEDDDAQ